MPGMSGRRGITYEPDDQWKYDYLRANIRSAFTSGYCANGSIHKFFYVGKCLSVYPAYNPSGAAWMKSPVLSIIIPSYNHCRFLPERLNSIYAQLSLDFELIILDDASQDGSVELIREILQGKEYTLVVNTENSGSPFGQWEKGFQLARGNYIWIAESDDSCDPAFVSSILPDLESGRVALAFTRTMSIDDDGHETNNAYWPELFNRNFFAQNQLISCRRFLCDFLGARNCIPNVSSVIFSTQGVKREVRHAAQSAAHFRFAGDWIFWACLLLAYGERSMLYISSPLCLHRDHGSTTRIVLERNREGQRMREYSKVIQQVLCLQGLHGALTSLRALSSGWWDWSYHQYLFRYKPLFVQRLIGFPQGGIHLIGYWVYRIRGIFGFRRLTCLLSSSEPN